MSRMELLMIALCMVGCSGSVSPIVETESKKPIVPIVATDAGCTMGASACDGAQPVICSETASWEAAGSPCATACINGACTACTPGSTTCNGNSVLECSSDGVYSGSVQCSGETPNCVQGPTMAACGCSGTVCGAECVDTRFDNKNCGVCGNDCGDYTCEASTCQNPCGLNGATCANGCTDLYTDSLNCGACDNGCPPTTYCSGGKCVGS